MHPTFRRPRPSRAFVVLTPGWSGEHVLVRLLSAGGAVRSFGYWLAVARHRPDARLRALLRARTNEGAHGVLVQPTHLWALNNLDPYDTVGRLVDDGVTVLSLQRRSTLDCGLSRALCGPGGEVLPGTPQTVDAASVAVHRDAAEAAAAWLDEVMPPSSVRLVFEDDLLDPDARRRTLTRLAAVLDLDPWPAPIETQLPSTAALWGHVANPEQLRVALARLELPDAASRPPVPPTRPRADAAPRPAPRPADPGPLRRPHHGAGR